MKYFYLLVAIMFSFVAHSQSYYTADIIFSDGTTKTGFVKVPNGDQKQVSYKATLDDNPQKLKSDDLSTIIFKMANEQFYILERSAVKMLATKKNGEIYSRTTKKKGWFFLDRHHKKLNLYSAGQQYKIAKDGEFKIKSSGQTGFTGIGFYFKRPGEEDVTYITAKMSGIQVNHEKLFRNYASTYLSDNKSLAKRIDNGEFKSHELDKIFDIYTSN